jgi:putative transposase
MIGALKQLEAGRTADDLGREMGVSKHTLYAWKAKYGGMTVSEAQEAKQLLDENTRLKKLVVDLSLDREMLKAVIAKNGWGAHVVVVRFPLGDFAASARSKNRFRSGIRRGTCR